MSRPQQGADAPREGTNRRKRRKRRPGRGKNARRNAPDNAQARSGVANPEQPIDARRGNRSAVAGDHNNEIARPNGSGVKEPGGIATITNGQAQPDAKGRQPGKTNVPDAANALPGRERGDGRSGGSGKKSRHRKRHFSKTPYPQVGSRGVHRGVDGTNQGTGPIRNLRPPIKPVPAARFVPPQAVNSQIGAMSADSAVNGAKTNVVTSSAGSAGYFAALDLGTNNCRLLVAAPRAANRFKVVDAFSRIIRLGEGLGQTGRLSEEAMDRAIDALLICASKLTSRPIAGLRMIATEACRIAANGEEFLNRVHTVTGLKLEIVDRETEARLAAEGCGSLMDNHAEGAVLFDIGGGSSELILVNRKLSRSRRISRQIAGWTSLPLGVVTLSERHGGKQVSRAAFDGMVDEVLTHLEAFDGRHSLAEIWGQGRTHLLGTSGTVTTIAGVHLNLPRYDRRKVDGIWLSDRQIDKVIDALLEMDYEQRASNPCIRRERADLVLAGCAILQAIRITWPSDRLRVADRGLREGILNQLMQQSGVWDRASRNSSQTARNYRSGDSARGAQN